MSTTALFLFGSFFLLLFLNMPIAIALGLSTGATLLAFDLPIQSLPVWWQRFPLGKFLWRVLFQVC